MSPHLLSELLHTNVLESDHLPDLVSLTMGFWGQSLGAKRPSEELISVPVRGVLEMANGKSRKYGLRTSGHFSKVLSFGALLIPRILCVMASATWQQTNLPRCLLSQHLRSHFIAAGSQTLPLDKAKPNTLEMAVL